MGVPISFGSPYSQILKGHVEQGHVLRRQGHTLREARLLLLLPEPKQQIIHPQSRGRRQALAPALCSHGGLSMRETSAVVAADANNTQIRNRAPNAALAHAAAQIRDPGRRGERQFKRADHCANAAFEPAACKGGRARIPRVNAALHVE